MTRYQLKQGCLPVAILPWLMILTTCDHPIGGKSMVQRAKAKKTKHYMQNKGGTYKNGQLISEQKGNVLTYYFKTGLVKAKGKSVEGSMEGKWIFNRESG